MKHRKKALLAAGLIAGAAAMTGCSAATTPVATPTPETAAQITAQPETAEGTVSPDESPVSGGEETPGPLSLTVGDKEVEADALLEEGKLLLPLEETAEALGWTTEREEKETEGATRKSVRLQKDESVITVAWTVSDNTAKSITWQKDGLLIPVDAELTTVGGKTYVPSAFFETAMDVSLQRTADGVQAAAPEPQQTPPNDVEQTNEKEAAD